MAHVAISRDFIARVQNKITVMRNAEVNALGKVPQISVPVDSDVVVKTVWGDYLHLREKIPSSWKNSSDACRLTMRTTTTTKNDEKDDTYKGSKQGGKVKFDKEIINKLCEYYKIYFHPNI